MYFFQVHLYVMVKKLTNYAQIGPNFPFHRKKSNLDNKALFRYLECYRFRLIVALICGTTAKADSYSTFLIHPF